MRLLLMGQTALERFQHAFPHITVINFNTILHDLSNGDPGLTIEVCTNHALKLALFNDLERVYGQVAYFGSGITADVVEETQIPIFVQDLETPGKYQPMKLIEATKKSHKKTNKVYDGLSQLMGPVVTEAPSRQLKYDPATVFLMVLYNHKEDITMPSIEESIKAAMIDLGITDADGNPIPKAAPAPKPEPAAEPTSPPAPKAAPNPKTEPKPKTPKAEPRPQPVPAEKLKTTIPESKSKANAVTADEPVENIFCKLKDGHMALILPVGLEMEQQEIAGTKVNVVNVDLPDWTSERLQALKICQGEKPTQKAAPVPVERTPIKGEKKPTPASKAASTTHLVDGNLDELLARKKELTAQIAKARAAGDTQLVNDLRRQRRVVRGQINKLGG